MKDPNKLHWFGTVLLWLGVLVWAPYFYLRIAGQSPSLLAFLPFHLAGVFGGSRMRTAANKRLGKPKVKRKGYKLTAHVLIIAGVLVWIPYFILKFTAGSVELHPYLTLHLIGVLGGTGVLIVGGLVQLYRRNEGG